MTTTASFNPFPGLRPFREGEAHLFFGRSAQIDELLGELATCRFVAVTGASGSGKSSLVAAGLLPALHGGFSRRVGSHWRVATLRPGGNPTRNLAGALADADVLARDNSDPTVGRDELEARLRRSGLGLADVARSSSNLEDARLLVVVDQFEELFRFHATDAAAFVQLLLEAARAEDAPVDVVVTMRSDFLGDCSQFADLPDAISRGLYLVPRLTRTQLREAIVAPAAVGGASLDPRLVQRVLNDAGADPDMLPVVQHAMMRTWDTWAGGDPVAGVIDVEQYEACGGFEEALSRHADEAYFGLQSEPRRLVAEFMFKRITELGDDHREIRRPTAVAEIAAVAGTSAEEVDECIEPFAAPGTSFVVRDADGIVDISHESLIRQWPRLQDWVREEAASRDVYRRLADAADRCDRGEAALLRDPDLELASRWWSTNQPNQAWADRYDPAFEPAARYLARSRRAARRRRALTVGGVALLAVFAVVAVSLAVTAVRQRNRAEDATAEARRQQGIAVSRQLASASTDAGTAARALSLLTALEALRSTAADGIRIPEAEEALREALAGPLSVLLGVIRPGGEGQLNAIAFSTDGSALVTGSADGVVSRWDPTTPDAPPRVLVHGAGINAVAFSPDGRWMATGDQQGVVLLWSVADLDAPPRPLGGHEDGITAMAFSPDSTLLATGSLDERTNVWRVDDASAPPVALTGHEGFVLSLAFDSTGERLATGGSDGNTLVRTVADLAAEPRSLHRDANGITVVAFSPDGRWLATGGVGTSAALWDLTEPATVPIVLQHGSAITTLDFSGDGRWLATGSKDESARMWDLRDARGPTANPRVLQHTDAVDVVAFSPDGRWLATGSDDHVARLYDVVDARVDPVVLGGHEAAVTSLAFDGGARLATGSVDGTARLWDLDHLAPRPEVLDDRTDGGTPRPSITSLAFSGDGRWLATGAADNVARLWPVDALDRTPVEYSPEIVAGYEQAGIDALAFSPDGRQLATGGGDRVVRLWDVNDPNAPPVALTGLPAAVTSLSFSPDGRRLAVGAKDKVAVVWDLTDPASAPQRLTANNDEVTSVLFTPDGSWLLTGSRDGEVRRWPAAELTTDPVVWSQNGAVTALAADADSTRIAASSGDGIVLVWDVTDVDRTQPLMLGAGARVRSVAFSDGEGAGAALLVAVGSNVQSWDVGAPDPASSVVNPVVLTDGSAGVSAVASSPAAGRFASANDDGTARVWLPLGPLVALGCDGAGRNLTRAEWDRFLTGQEYRSTCPQWPAGS